MNSITFSGLASGIDTGSIIEQLVELEKRPATLLEGRKQDAERHKAIVTDISSELKAIKEVMAGLETGDDIQSFAATTSSEDTIEVTSSGAAFPGTYSMTVDQLAQGQTSVSNQFVTSAGPGAAGTIDITVGTEAAVNVAYSDTDSLYDIASLINDSDADVNASVLYDGVNGYQLMVSSKDTGADSAVSFVETGAALGLDQPANIMVAAQDSIVTMNGISVQRSTNTMSDVLSGVTLDLKRVTGTDPATVVKVERDVEGVREKVQGFVDGYNKLTDLLNRQLEYSGAQKGSDTLFGDGTLQGLQRRLGEIVTRAYSHDGGEVSLGGLGVELDNRGKLTIDSTKFDEAMASDAEAIESLFAGEGAGALAQAFSDLSDTYTRSGDGIFEGKNDGIDDRIRGYDDQIERIENRAASLGDRLRRQFSAMEEATIALQTQQSFLLQLVGVG